MVLCSLAFSPATHRTFFLWYKRSHTECWGRPRLKGETHPFVRPREKVFFSFFFFLHRWCEISHGVQAPLSSLRWSCMGAPPSLGPDWLVFIDLTWETTQWYLGGCFSGGRECFEGISRISHATLIIVVDKPWLTSHDCPEGHELPFFFFFWYTPVTPCRKQRLWGWEPPLDERRTKN